MEHLINQGNDILLLERVCQTNIVPMLKPYIRTHKSVLSGKQGVDPPSIQGTVRGKSGETSTCVSDISPRQSSRPLAISIVQFGTGVSCHEIGIPDSQIW